MFQICYKPVSPKRIHYIVDSSACQITEIRQYWQGAKKIIFTACLSGKLKLAFTSPVVISTSPKSFWRAYSSQFFCYLNSSKNITCPSGQIKTEFTSPIAKSTNPGLSDTTFFERWLNMIEINDSAWIRCSFRTLPWRKRFLCHFLDCT